MPRLAVLGYPVSHSRSPAMQNAALAELGLGGKWSYGAIEVAPDHFAELVRSLPDDDFAGVNVTVPHKIAALAAADSASPTAREIGAANMLSFSDRRVSAENTDASGVIEAIGRSVTGKRALVIGAGGSARAAAWALREGGAQVSIWNRTPAKAEALASALGVGFDDRAAGDERRVEHLDLIVNATTVGLEQAATRPPAQGDLEALPLRVGSIGPGQIIVDLVYGSHETALVAAARKRGAEVVDGLEVLVRQGAASLRLWTGHEPPLETMRRAAADMPA